MNLIMKWLVVGCVAVSCNVFADSINDLIDGTRESIIRAESYVSEISDDADMGYIVSILSSASLDWDVALKAQEAVSLCLDSFPLLIGSKGAIICFIMFLNGNI